MVERKALDAVSRIRNSEGHLLLVRTRAASTADDPLRDAPQGLAGFPPTARYGHSAPRATTRSPKRSPRVCPSTTPCAPAASCVAPGVLIVRAVSRSMEPLQRALTDCWTQLRPLVHGVEPKPLRLWTT